VQWIFPAREAVPNSPALLDGLPFQSEKGRLAISVCVCQIRSRASGEVPGIAPGFQVRAFRQRVEAKIVKTGIDSY
jgi:hypothetical protein